MTRAELAVKFLRDSAAYFRLYASQNPAAAKQMSGSADIFDRAAALIESDPAGATQGVNHAQMGAGLLRDAAAFLRELGAANAPIQDQMNYNAEVFEDLSSILAQNPLAEVE